jgi:hypothetical protein
MVMARGGSGAAAVSRVKMGMETTLYLSCAQFVDVSRKTVGFAGLFREAMRGSEERSSESRG